MKRIVGIVVCALVCVSIVQPIYAQNLLSGIMGPAGVNSTWRSSTSRLVPLTFRVGWVDHRNGVRRTVNVGDDPTQIYLWPLQGLWLGAETGYLVSNSLALTLAGGALVASDNPGMVRFEPGFTFADFDASNQWAILDAGLSYSFMPSFQVIGGFRWDYFNIKLDATTLPAAAALLGGLTGAEIDTKFNSYLPYVGVQVCRESSQGKLLTRVVGFPWAPGAVKSLAVDEPGPQAHAYSQAYRKGYFFEILAEYTRQLFGSGTVGGFVRYNQITALGQPGVLKNNTGGVLTTNGDVAISMDRRSWTFGGSFSCDFNLW